MSIETTYSEARKQFRSFLNCAVDDREIIFVRRRTGKDVAMIAADELNSLIETAHLLRSPKNAERLLTALSRARAESLSPLASLDALEQQVGLDAPK
jgi:antitoxin YefM